MRHQGASIVTSLAGLGFLALLGVLGASPEDDVEDPDDETTADGLTVTGDEADTTATTFTVRLPREATTTPG